MCNYVFGGPLVWGFVCLLSSRVVCAIHEFFCDLVIPRDLIVPRQTPTNSIGNGCEGLSQKLEKIPRNQ